MKGIFLDTETNGLDPFTHTIIEIALKIIDMHTGECIDSYETSIYCNSDEWSVSSKESLHINGFSFEMLQNSPKKEVVADAIKALFKQHKLKRGKAVFICQNPSFDRVFFSKLIPSCEQERHLYPYHWLDLASMFWGIRLIEKKEPYPWSIGLSKNKIACAYSIPGEGIPHKAMNGVNHLIECYKAVVGYPVEGALTTKA